MLDEFLLDSVLYARQRWILHDNIFMKFGVYLVQKSICFSSIEIFVLLKEVG